MIVYDPRGQSWGQWCALMVELLAQQHIGFEREDRWREFANKLSGSSRLGASGIPDNRGYTNWQDWAAALVGSLNRF